MAILKYFLDKKNSLLELNFSNGKIIISSPEIAVDGFNTIIDGSETIEKISVDITFKKVGFPTEDCNLYCENNALMNLSSFYEAINKFANFDAKKKAITKRDFSTVERSSNNDFTYYTIKSPFDDDFNYQIGAAKKRGESFISSYAIGLELRDGTWRKLLTFERMEPENFKTLAKALRVYFDFIAFNYNKNIKNGELLEKNVISIDILNNEPSLLKVQRKNYVEYFGKGEYIDICFINKRGYRRSFGYVELKEISDNGIKVKDHLSLAEESINIKDIVNIKTFKHSSPTSKMNSSAITSMFLTNYVLKSDGLKKDFYSLSKNTLQSRYTKTILKNVYDGATTEEEIKNEVIQDLKDMMFLESEKDYLLNCFSKFL